MPAEIHPAIVKSFDSVTYTATVQIMTALHTYLAGVRVDRGIASADMTAGRRCAVVLFDPANPTDAVLFAVWT
jgi:hypothetical protein